MLTLLQYILVYNLHSQCIQSKIFEELQPQISPFVRPQISQCNSMIKINNALVHTHTLNLRVCMGTVRPTGSYGQVKVKADAEEGEAEDVEDEGGGEGDEASRPPPDASSHASSSSARAPDSSAIRTSARRSRPARTRHCVRRTEYSSRTHTARHKEHPLAGLYVAGNPLQ